LVELPVSPRLYKALEEEAGKHRLSITEYLDALIIDGEVSS
jgi:hypothetical protein